MRQKMSQWPAVFVRIPPKVYEQIEAQAEERMVPMSALIRERLGRTYGPEAR